MLCSHTNKKRSESYAITCPHVLKKRGVCGVQFNLYYDEICDDCGVVVTKGGRNVCENTANHRRIK